jgi:DNA-binding NtrC family response regulator
MTDQRMPEMTGVEFLKRVRGEHPDAIRLLFTGYADIRAVIDAINQGNVYRYITKPWDPDELQTVIREAVRAVRPDRRAQACSKSCAARTPSSSAPTPS